MVERIEIADEHSARAWLETQDHQTQVWFSVRYALRILPGMGTLPKAGSSMYVLPCMRAVLCSAAAANAEAGKITEFKTPAAFATVAVGDAVSSASHARDIEAAHRGVDKASIFTAVESCVAASAAVRNVGAVRSPLRKTDQLFLRTEREAALLAASNDSKKPMNWDMLWSNNRQPDVLNDGWTALKQYWETDRADWSFWIEWYERILAGNPLPWELTQRIALEVTDDEWEEGQATVARRISEIRAAYDVQTLAKRIAEEAYLAQPGTPGMGHNQPPSLLDDGLQGQAQETIVWVAAKELEAQAEADDPEPSRIRKAVALLAGVLKAAGLWVGGTIATGISVATVTVIKKGADAWAVQNQDKLVELIDAALKWLSLMP